MTTEKRPKSEIDLRKLMQKLGMRTNAFAEACGVSSQSMAQFLRTKSLTTASIYKMATALDIDPRDMFFPIDEEDGSDLFTKGKTSTNIESEDQNVNTTTFCPHCGEKVRVGVVLLPE